jgi:hypothetical protein
VSSENALDSLDAVVYADLFDCAVDLDEIWRYSRTEVRQEALGEMLAKPSVCALIQQSNGFYFLSGRDELAGLRAERITRSEALLKRARAVARWVRHVPFVRGILLTGSVAARNADAGADVDLLLIVASGRLATVFALLGPLSRLVSRRLLCPNYYLSEAHLKLSRRDHYVAREVVQAEPLTGTGESLLLANDWVDDLLPNARERSPVTTPVLSGGGRVQRALESCLRGRLGDWIEARANRLAHARLAVHHTTRGEGVPERVSARLDEGIELRFHESGIAAGLMDRYRESKRDAALVLASADASEA